MRAAVVIASFLLLSTAAYSATIYVPGDHGTIQEAINASSNGDTIIDGSQLGSVVTCSSYEGPGTVLEGFTLENGRAYEGGGMHIYRGSYTVPGSIRRAWSYIRCQARFVGLARRIEPGTVYMTKPDELSLAPYN